MSTNSLDNALSIDISVLVNLLRRNRCAHGRTQYFQRTSMVVRALQRCNVISLRQRIRTLQISLQQSPPRKRRRIEQEEWTMEKGQEKNEVDTVKEELLELQEIIVKDLPEILSRIQHASSALIVEIARGFFLPLCTVAIAALARVRVLVMQLGREALQELQSCWSQWSSIRRNNEASAKLTQEECATAMEAFVEVDTNARLAKMQQRPTLKESLQSLGIQSTIITSICERIKELSEPKSNMSDKNEHEDLVQNEGSQCEAKTLQENDIGMSYNASAVGDAAQGVKPVTKGSKIEPEERDTDVNMDLVRKVQAKKARDRDKTPKKKQKEEKDSGKKKKKKRKKEGKKKDVFDEIFGD